MPTPHCFAQGSVNVTLLENLQNSLEKLTYPEIDDKSLYYKLLDQHMTTINNYDSSHGHELTAIAIENFVHVSVINRHHYSMGVFTMSF